MKNGNQSKCNHWALCSYRTFTMAPWCRHRSYLYWTVFCILSKGINDWALELSNININKLRWHERWRHYAYFKKTCAFHMQGKQNISFKVYLHQRTKNVYTAILGCDGCNFFSKLRTFSTNPVSLSLHAHWTEILNSVISFPSCLLWTINYFLYVVEIRRADGVCSTNRESNLGWQSCSSRAISAVNQHCQPRTWSELLAVPLDENKEGKKA